MKQENIRQLYTKFKRSTVFPTGKLRKKNSSNELKDEAGESLPTLKEISSKSREVNRISDGKIIPMALWMKQEKVTNLKMDI